MGILDGNQKHEPMHYGEVFGAWSYLMAAQSGLAASQVAANHAGDEDLKKFLQDYINNVKKQEIQQLEELLKANGVGLPPAPPERPVANIEDIPPGARMMDPEIANATAQLISAGLISCSTMMGSITREDIGMMFAQFHAQKAQYGGMLLKLLKEKGWLIPPPLHNPRNRG
ncbi:DUF3231 family protein [Clostridium formicaceticum]|uniref:DUF3231 domain-containing protein n=1 Tax=Clostridium formicaceticum TaxID=1497 RepID=A0AAC9RMY5_9CLOT|nr:DUF3231 family protein [Clostridium formicaceticum]AOY74637.1 hypothetical protein BJL90_00900 [Clostridium formicaceticum]ARE89006.1 hypothetical protein CLFO_34120 [Clostridium formicaceticum]